jgi:hypothetical protein
MYKIAVPSATKDSQAFQWLLTISILFHATRMQHVNFRQITFCS